jgi:hypothetical protein
MKILAIDPGNTLSAWTEYDTETKTIGNFAKDGNDDVLDEIKASDADAISIEMIASYGMAVGASVFETCLWIGRFLQHWKEHHPDNAHVRLVFRKEVKMHLCGTTKAKDSNIRQAIMDRYGSTREKAIGKKASPGPMYGVSKDVWAAIGVAITAAETKDETDEDS